MPRFVLAIGTLLALTACGTTATNSPSFAAYDAGAVPGGPGASKRFALGHTPNDSALGVMNMDVGPDGAELPTGKGTVAEGAAVYAAQCAQCHGKAGEGMAPAYPALIGRDPAGEGFKFALDAKLTRTIGNYWPHATTVFDYVKRAMPLLTPGTLSDDQVYAVTAYLLAANKIIPDSSTLDAAALRAVKMPYESKFVRDDRKPNAGGTR